MHPAYPLLWVCACVSRWNCVTCKHNRQAMQSALCASPPPQSPPLVAPRRPLVVKLWRAANLNNFCLRYFFFFFYWIFLKPSGYGQYRIRCSRITEILLYVRVRREEEIKYEKDIVEKCKEEPKLFYKHIKGKMTNWDHRQVRKGWEEVGKNKGDKWSYEWEF